MVSDTFMGWVVFILCSVGGLIMIGGSLLLLGKRIIVLDSGGKQTTTVKLPFGFGMSTQFPVLVMLLFGVFLFALPIYRSPAICGDTLLHKKHFPEMITLKGNTGSEVDVRARAVVADRVVRPEEEVMLKVPLNTGEPYTIVYTDPDGDQIYDVEPLNWEKVKDRTYTLTGIKLKLGGGEAKATPTPVQQQLVTAAVENEFKDQ